MQDEAKSIGLFDQIRENKVISVAIAAMTILGAVNVTSVVSTVRYVDNLATKDNVSGAVATERKIAASDLADYARIAEGRFAGLEDKIDRVRAFTEVVPELRNLLSLKCMGTQGLDATIDRLKREYAILTGESYIEPPCERLIATAR